MQKQVSVSNLVDRGGSIRLIYNTVLNWSRRFLSLNTAGGQGHVRVTGTYSAILPDRGLNISISSTTDSSVEHTKAACCQLLILDHACTGKRSDIQHVLTSDRWKV